MVSLAPNKKLFIVLGVIALLFFTSFYKFRWTGKTGEEWKMIIWSDARGYYYYLPSVFLHHDLHNQPFDPLYTVTNAEGKLVNRYYIGTAVLESPFFFAACVQAKLGGYPLDGNNQVFAFWVGMAPICYVLIGLYFLYGILRYIGVNEKRSLFLLLITAIGTHLFFYTVYKGNFSHAFSFFSITWFYALVIRVAQSGLTGRRVFLLALAATLLVMVRPVNLLVLILTPFFFAGWNDFVNRLLQPLFKLKHIAFIAAGALPLVILQCWAWYVQTGHLVQWSYNQEGFYFANPKIIVQLFSFDQGLFIYNPVLFFALIGLPVLFRYNRYRFMCITVFMLMFIYVTASWWSHTYGNSFGIRPYVDITTVFIILVGYLFTLRKTVVYITAALLVVCSCLSLLYTYQFYKGIIPGTGMNAERFFTVFGKTSTKYAGCFGGMYDLPPYSPKGLTKLGEVNVLQKQDTVVQCRDVEFPATSSFTYPDTLEHIRHVWVKARVAYYIPPADTMNEALFVFDVRDKNDAPVYYYTFPLKDYRFEANGVLHEHDFANWFPNLIHGGNTIKMYIWNKNKEPFALHRFELSVWVPVQ